VFGKEKVHNVDAGRLGFDPDLATISRNESASSAWCAGEERKGKHQFGPTQCRHSSIQNYQIFPRWTYPTALFLITHMCVACKPRVRLPPVLPLPRSLAASRYDCLRAPDGPRHAPQFRASLSDERWWCARSCTEHRRSPRFIYCCRLSLASVAKLDQPHHSRA